MHGETMWPMQWLGVMGSMGKVEEQLKIESGKMKMKNWEDGESFPVFPDSENVYCTGGVQNL
jgi:hypothetical protein